MIFLESERLLFRTHEPQDEQLCQHAHGPGSLPLRGRQPWLLEKAHTRFPDEYLGRPKETYGLWATILKDEWKYIGCCGLRAAEDRSGAHLGYYLARPYWGRGLASEALISFMDVAFNRLRLARLLAEAEKGNDASEHILQKLGFKYASSEAIPAS